MSKNYKLNFTRELAKPTLALASRLVMARAKSYADEVETLEKRLKTLTAAKKIPKALLKTGILQYENKVQKELKKEVMSLYKGYGDLVDHMDSWKKRNGRFIKAMLIKLQQK